MTYFVCLVCCTAPVVGTSFVVNLEDDDNKDSILFCCRIHVCLLCSREDPRTAEALGETLPDAESPWDR